jgi:hypothetical protein
VDHRLVVTTRALLRLAGLDNVLAAPRRLAVVQSRQILRLTTNRRSEVDRMRPLDHPSNSISSVADPTKSQGVGTAFGQTFSTPVSTSGLSSSSSTSDFMASLKRDKDAQKADKGDGGTPSFSFVAPTESNPSTINTGGRGSNQFGSSSSSTDYNMPSPGKGKNPFHPFWCIWWW